MGLSKSKQSKAVKPRCIPPSEPKSNSVETVSESPPRVSVTASVKPLNSPGRENHVKFVRKKESSSSVDSDDDFTSYSNRRDSRRPTVNRSVNCTSLLFNTARSAGPDTPLPSTRHSATKSKRSSNHSRRHCRVDKYNFICAWLEQSAAAKTKFATSSASNADLMWGNDQVYQRQRPQPPPTNPSERSRKNESVTVEIPLSGHSDANSTTADEHSPSNHRSEERGIRFTPTTDRRLRPRRNRSPPSQFRKQGERGTHLSVRRPDIRKESVDVDKEVKGRIFRELERRRLLEEESALNSRRHHRRPEEPHRSRRSSRRGRHRDRRDFMEPVEYSRHRTRERPSVAEYDRVMRNRNDGRRMARPEFVESRHPMVYNATVEVQKAIPEQVNQELEPFSHGDCIPPDISLQVASAEDNVTSSSPANIIKLLDFSNIVPKPPIPQRDANKGVTPTLIAQEGKSRLCLHRADNDLDMTCGRQFLKRSSPCTSFIHSATTGCPSFNSQSNQGAMNSQQFCCRVLEPLQSKQQQVAPIVPEGTGNIGLYVNQPIHSSSGTICRKTNETGSGRNPVLEKSNQKRKRERQRHAKITTEANKRSENMEELIVKRKRHKDAVLYTSKPLDLSKTEKTKQNKADEQPEGGDRTRKFSDIRAEDLPNESEYSSNYYSDSWVEEADQGDGEGAEDMDENWYPDDDFAEQSAQTVTGSPDDYPSYNESSVSKDNEDIQQQPEVTTCGIGGICFKLPGRVTHKTTIKVAHFPRSDPICVNLPSNVPPPCYYPYCCPPPCLPCPPDPGKQMNNCNVYNFGGRGRGQPPC